MADQAEATLPRRAWTVAPGFLAHAIPAIVAVVLSLPCMGFTYQWDDYDFLTNVLVNKLGDLLPDPADPFYRPISRGVYFLGLSTAGEQGALLGHILNALLLIGVVLMLVRLATRLAGPAAGLIAGLTFAGINAVPTLVGWVCCDQDLFSMLFILVALDFRWSGRRGAALGATAAALLSKETALAVVPALVLFDWILDRKPYRVGRAAASYALLVAAWSTVHPAVRILLSRGLRGGATGYVGLENPEWWPSYLGKYLLTMSNIRITLPPPPWPTQMTALLLVAVALAFAGVLHLHRSSGNSSAHPVRSKSILLFGSLLCLGPLVLTSIMIRSWAPYYSAYPAMGLAILTGSALSRVHLSWRLAFVVMFFAMGVWTRENSLDARVATEKNFRVTSPALREVSANFKRLVRQFPPKSQVLITVEARGNAGVYTHMFTFGALRVWYAEPTIRARRPEDRVASGTPEYLFAITPDLDVVEIDRETLRAQTASGRDPDYAYVAPAVRAYCTGLFGSGETDRAVDILLHMQEINPKLQSVHWRTAATFLLADGRIADADSILHQALPLSRALALANMRAVLAERPPGRILDDAALHAFDIEPDDAEAIRELMRWFAKFGYAEPALRFADRLERLSPGDSEAAATIRKMSWILDQRRRAPPAPGAL